MLWNKPTGLRSQADEALAAAELAEANARIAAANIVQEEANAKASTIRERADLLARKRDLQRTIELAPLEEEARRLEEIRLAADRANAKANDSQAQANAEQEAKVRRREANARIGRNLVTAAFAGCTLVAMGGQVAAYWKGMGWWLIAALVVSVVAECLALAMQHMANEAYLEGDAAGGLQVGSLLLAGYAATLNWAHWSDDGAPTGAAALFSFCSFVPPLLWGAHAKSRHRAELRAQGRARRRAPNFGKLRWILARGETFAAFAWSIRNGESDPDAAVIRMHLERTSEATDAQLASVRGELIQIGGSLRDIRVSLADAVLAYVSHVEANAGERSPQEANAHPNDPNDDDDEDEQEPLPNLPDAEEVDAMTSAEKLSRARLTVVLARQQGIDLKGRGAELGRVYGYTERWGQKRVSEELPHMFAIPGSAEDDEDDRQEKAQ